MVAATLAVAATGGALLTSAAGAAPAMAATANAPAGGHTITITAHATQGHSGTTRGGTVLPCAKIPGAYGNGGCNTPPIDCDINVYTPGTTPPPVQVIGNASVVCDAPVTSIELTEHIDNNVPGRVGVDHVLVSGVSSTGTVAVVNSCKPNTTYTNSAIAFIEFPDGTSTSLNGSAAFFASYSSCNLTPPPPTGGGGGLPQAAAPCPRKPHRPHLTHLRSSARDLPDQLAKQPCAPGPATRHRGRTHLRWRVTGSSAQDISAIKSALSLAARPPTIVVSPGRTIP